MSTEIDERVVEMKFDNKNFEKNVSTSMSTLKKFKDNSARLKDSNKSIVGAAWKAVDHGIKLPTAHQLPETKE